VSGEPARPETQVLAVLNDERAHDDGLAHARAGFGHQPDVHAQAVSTEVARRLTGPRALTVLGRGRGALHLDLDGFVVTLTGPGVPRMPNGIAVDRVRAPARVGWEARCPPLWDPRVAALPGGAAAVRALSRWLGERTAAPGLTLAQAPDRLLGRGRGLTPEGDDILAGAAVGLRALGPAAGLDRAAVDALVGPLCPADVRERTNALSATLLRLAVAGAAPEPVGRLLAPAGDRGGDRPRGATPGHLGGGRRQTVAALGRWPGVALG
jgi:hypothetical protein